MLESKLNVWIEVHNEELKKLKDEINGFEIENLIKCKECKSFLEEHLEDLTPLDLRIMYHFMNPENRYKENNYNLNLDIVPISTFLKCNENIDKDLVATRIEMLISKKLLKDFSYRAVCTPTGALSPRISELGMKLMKYIIK
ncbi:hypothetical protein [Clostridium perfringens]|uniref:hypothetical protein n=1 Tax=Clostridium perfringens TaxID=1502 RepID=UPI001C85AFCC|nr:hypothetical protein [Clostridium perfringens]MDK0552864.1 hypothetical protein [Clostridium perfringens]MDK0936285.1 hypothetical protein [Clostridium perfringens]